MGFSSVKSSPFSVIVLIIVYVSITVYCFISGIYGLSRTPQSLGSVFDGDYEKGDFAEGIPAFGLPESFDVKHTVNYIPVLKEHYFLIISDDGENAVFVRANKKFGNNFDSETLLNNGNVEVRGAIRRFDSSIERDLRASLAGDSEGIDLSFYIDTYSNRLNIICLIIGVCNILMPIAAVIMIKRNIPLNTKGTASISLGIVFIICDMLFLYVLFMR